CARGYYGSSYW
nr:immunoglobulin heavy chain junction region [Mus musculus]